MTIIRSDGDNSLAGGGGYFIFIIGRVRSRMASVISTSKRFHDTIAWASLFLENLVYTPGKVGWWGGYGARVGMCSHVNINPYHAGTILDLYMGSVSYGNWHLAREAGKKSEMLPVYVIPRVSYI